RELKLWGTEDDVEESFADIASLSNKCRFSDCTHSGEPGCAVQEALVTGELEQERYLRYLELSKEIAFLKTRTSESSRRNEERKWKQVSKFQKALKKERGVY
ncbi:MAG TPA: ribosome small subunit-dependent GTPase A, partial [Treponemataceae bacterium]|nr:ribosome small subunit-dependent GTPase A [Treponemataceae bacterium]